MAIFYEQDSHSSRLHPTTKLYFTFTVTLLLVYHYIAKTRSIQYIIKMLEAMFLCV